MTNGNDGAFGKKERMGSAYMGDITVRTYGDGLTKREYFAAMAMQGFLANSVIAASLAEMHRAGGDPKDDYAKLSIKMADALIAALNKEAE